ncbi:MAG TPA: Spy/CpxP family protein refolding chaperone [Gemmatimonadaceae bacterium]|nr:Spy/CpxP family protein refolding chaperone [Gemmatimonadaceae bacterium]
MSRRSSVFAILAGLMALVSAGKADGQAPPGVRGNSDVPTTRRALLEQRLRERTGELVRRRLQLTDDQMTRLQATNRDFEPKRVELLKKESEVRRDLREQLTSGTADQNRVAALLDQTMQLERQRLELVQTEQRELAKFLTPVQRAKLFGLQSELRKRTQDLRNGPRQRPGPPGKRRARRPPA